MGNCIDKCVGRQRASRRIHLLLVGLDNAGKTRTANSLCGSGDREVVPSVGFRAYNLSHRKYSVVVYDLGGGPGFRAIWERYYSDVHGVIFVVDSTDLGRLEECRQVLKGLLSHEKISGKPVLILANKQDVEGALDDVDLVERLDIEAVVNRYRCPTRVEAYTAASVETNVKKKQKMDPGLQKGYVWLLNYIIHRYGDINLRVQTDINAEKTRRELKMIQKEIGTSTDENLTSFENPNYIGKTEVDVVNCTSPEGIIVVREATANKSIDFDAIEVANIEEDKSKAEKMSSLFGDRLENGSIDKPEIELEVRTKVRKLSPILRGRFTVTAHNESAARPQTSPSLDLKSTSAGDFVKSEYASSLNKPSPSGKERGVSGAGKIIDVGLVEPAPTGSALTDRKQVLPPIGKLDNSNLQNVNGTGSSLSDNSILAVSAVVDHHSSPKRPATHSYLKSSSQDSSEAEDHPKGDGRPQSATQGVRRQLEKTKDTIKQKMSFKSLKRNRTSPEMQSSLFAYDPASSKPLGNHQQEEGGEFSTKTENYGRVGLRSDTVM